MRTSAAATPLASVTADVVPYTPALGTGFPAASSTVAVNVVVGASASTMVAAVGDAATVSVVDVSARSGSLGRAVMLTGPRTTASDALPEASEVPTEEKSPCPVNPPLSETVRPPLATSLTLPTGAGPLRVVVTSSVAVGTCSVTSVPALVACTRSTTFSSNDAGTTAGADGVRSMRSW